MRTMFSEKNIRNMILFMVIKFTLYRSNVLGPEMLFLYFRNVFFYSAMMH